MNGNAQEGMMPVAAEQRGTAGWLEFWSADNSIYVNGQHCDAPTPGNCSPTSLLCCRKLPSPCWTMDAATP